MKIGDAPIPLDNRRLKMYTLHFIDRARFRPRIRWDVKQCNMIVTPISD